MESERVGHVNFLASPPTTTAGDPPAASPLLPSPVFCERGGRHHFQSPVLILGSHQHLSPCLHGSNIPPEAGLTTVDPAKRTCFHNFFYIVADDIAKGLSSSHSSAVNGHWEKWDELCRDVVLKPLLIL